MITERTAIGWLLLTGVVATLALWATIAPGDLLLNAALLLAVLVGLWLGVWLAVRVRLNVPVAIVAYALTIIGWKVGRRVYTWTRKMRGKEPGFRLKVPQRKIAKTVFELRDFHRCGKYEVILGYGNGRPIKIDLSRLHWLVGGTTGGGKTNVLQLILCQLFLDPNFHDEIRVIDLKADTEDHLKDWGSLLKSYITTVDGAIEKIHSLVLEMNRRMHDGWDKRIFLFFDEVATGTWAVEGDIRKAMRAELGALSIMARSAGIVVVAATQHPRYDVLDKLISHNLRGKICLPVTHRSQAEVVLAEEPPDRLPNTVGEFLVRDHTIGLRRGRSLLVNLPDDVNKIVTARLVNFAEDDRLEFFRRSCFNLPVDKGLPGIAKMRPNLLAEDIDWSIEWMQNSRRNYALAGALIPPKARGQYYYLRKPYAEALLDVANYIRRGEWQEGPERFAEQGDDEEK